MSYTGLYNILSKPWANVKDIMYIGSCGKDVASKVRKKIELDLRANGVMIPVSRYKIVPMDKVIEYYNLDISHIYEMAQKEKKLKEK